jgi:hypothetical protein
MKTKADYTEANRQLALLQGWVDIVAAGAALLGAPPWAAENSRRQVQVPDWCGNWECCGPIMTKLGCAVIVIGNFVFPDVLRHPDIFERLTDHEDRNLATRYAIVRAAIEEIKAAAPTVCFSETVEA